MLSLAISPQILPLLALPPRSQSPHMPTLASPLLLGGRSHFQSFSDFSTFNTHHSHTHHHLHCLGSSHGNHERQQGFWVYGKIAGRSRKLHTLPSKCELSSASASDSRAHMLQLLGFPLSSDHSRLLSAGRLLRENQQLVSGFARFLSAFLLLFALSLAPHRALCQPAVAAPRAKTAQSSREQIQKQGSKAEVDKAKNLAKDAGSEFGSRETETEKEAEDNIYRLDEYNTSIMQEMVSKIEAEKPERERRFADALGTEQRVKELEAFLSEAPKSMSAIDEKVEEQKLALIVEARHLQGKTLIEMEAVLASLTKEKEKLNSEAEEIFKQYQDLKVEIERLGQEETKQTQEEVLEIKRKDLQGSLKELSENLSRVKIEIFAKKLQGRKSVTEDIVSALDHSLASIDDAWEKWKQRRSGRSTDSLKKKKSETLSNELLLVKNFNEVGETMWESTILALAVEVDDTKEILDEGTKKLMDGIKREAEESRKLHDIIKNLIRDRMKSVGEEKLELVRTPEELVVKGFPSAEVKWKFGDQEVNIPGTAPLHMALSWKKWRENKKAELKQHLLTNPEVGKRYVAKKQEQILIARDRVLAQTWFNERYGRWEISPLGASYAATKMLVESARIRHDRLVMFLCLKGESHDYFLDVQAYDDVFDKWGGFDTLYLKMTASDIPVTVEKMPIPFSEWDIEEQVQLPFKAMWWLLQKIWDLELVRTIKTLYIKVFFQAFEDLMGRFVFPLAYRVLPEKAKIFLKLELPEGAEAAEPTALMVWKQKAHEKVNSRSRKGDGPMPWWMAFALRCYVVGAPIVVGLPWVATILFFPFRPQPLGPTELALKMKKVEKLKRRLEPVMKQERVDPIKILFDRMKRVKQPEVSLKDFAGIETVKEEVNEVITFLKNPNAFKEIGARPPRGVLIVGESGTGKTTLAMAIAAETKVPLVEVQGPELEGGAWVGQGASNVRELFKTARELAPLIIFMDDFDHFAGIRGTTSDRSSQDHEALINQLLVELDGFETQEGVVLIATTSKPWTIDEALRRPGRMDRTIILPTPNRREREQILKKVAEDTMDKRLAKYVNWAEVAEKTAGLAPSQLKYVPQALESNALTGKITDEEELFSIHGWLARINSITPKWFQQLSWVQNWENGFIDWLGLRITKEEMEAAVETMDAYGQTKSGLEVRDPPYVGTREGKFPHAVWAAGRGLVALLLPNFDVVDHIWLDPTSWEGIGFTSLTKKLEEGYQETGTLTRTYYEKKLVLCFGSYVASQLLLPYGENNNLSRSEIEEAQEIAGSMVLRYGWGPDDSPIIYCAEGSQGAMSMGQAYEFEVASKVEKLYLVGYHKALEMLERNQQVLEALVEHLLENDVLTHKDMANILLEKGAIYEKEPFSLVSYSRATVVSPSTNGTGKSGMVPAGIRP